MYLLLSKRHHAINDTSSKDESTTEYRAQIGTKDNSGQGNSMKK